MVYTANIICEDLDLMVNHWRVQTVSLSTNLILISWVLVWVLLCTIMMTAVVVVSDSFPLLLVDC